MAALLDAMRATVREFVAREEKVERECRQQLGAAGNALAAQNQAQETAAFSQETASASALTEAQSRLERRFGKRQERIRRVHAAVNRRVSEAIARCDTQWKERTQSEVQAAERRRDEALAQAAREHNQFQENLAAAGESLAAQGLAVYNAFGAYGKFQRFLTPDRVWPEPDLTADAAGLFLQFQKRQVTIDENLRVFARLPVPGVFRRLPFWLVSTLLLGIAVAQPVLTRLHRNDLSSLQGGLALAGFVLVAAAYFWGRKTASPLAETLACDLARLHREFEVCSEKSVQQFHSEQARIRNEFEVCKQTLHQEWRQAVRDISLSRSNNATVIDQKADLILRRNEAWFEHQRARLERHHAEAMADREAVEQAELQAIADAHHARIAQIEAQYHGRWLELESDWRQRITPLSEQLQTAELAAEKLFPAWEPERWRDWTLPKTFQNAARFARLESSVQALVETLPRNPRLKWPGPSTLSAPLSLVLPARGSILFESGKSSGEDAIGAINNIIFRLLSVTPPGKLNFTIFDPVGLGQNFSALMHLADYEDGCINSRIWTQTAQFEEKLAELNEHMEKIIQMYLRNEYATIVEYNAQAGSVAEKYHFLVIASFPVNFSETAARRLRNIAANGARCGVFTLIHWDQRNALPQDFVPDELRANSVCLTHTSRGFELAQWHLPDVRLVFDPPPSAEFATAFLHQIGEGSKNANRVEVPFAQIAPPGPALWTESTTELLRVPIGRSGATKLQYLEIGSGTRQHALIAGKTGSGKSTLFHIIITNLALWCSPEQVEFYLVDFKKGVEFKCYGSRHLPHARVVAIESDREFGLSVLQRVDEELRRRGDLFRKAGAQDLAGYRRSEGAEAVPRTLLMIDEFQEYFTEEDRISQGAAVLLDRIVRQGRAFGIHVLLGSQTLGGAYTLARATIGQMVIRIALQCNEADAYLIMDQDNPAPRLLSRPGEGIYNDTAGSIEGNSPFQAVWLSDRIRDEYLAAIRARADQTPNRYPGPIVFEGNAPADVRENLALQAALQTLPAEIPRQASVWLGSPNSIKGPTEAVFRRQSGGNLLVVSQSEERTVTILAVALVSLAAQFPPAGVRFVLLDNAPAESPERRFLDRVRRTLPHAVTVSGNSQLAKTLEGLAEELKRRSEQESAGPEIFVLIQGLQNFKKLRQEDEFSFSSSPGVTPAAALLSLITEGPARGIHILAACDTYNNTNRFLGRKILSEFEMRVVFQMSASDSASLIDAPAASALGLHRALLYNDREGSLETFRPYAEPENEWVESLVGSAAFGPCPPAAPAET